MTTHKSRHPLHWTLPLYLMQHRSFSRFLPDTSCSPRHHAGISRDRSTLHHGEKPSGRVAELWFLVWSVNIATRNLSSHRGKEPSAIPRRRVRGMPDVNISSARCLEASMSGTGAVGARLRPGTNRGATGGVLGSLPPPMWIFFCRKENKTHQALTGTTK